MFYSTSKYWSSKLKWGWDKISTETLRTAINNVPKWRQLVLKATWNHTKWNFLLLYSWLTFILCKNCILTSYIFRWGWRFTFVRVFMPHLLYMRMTVVRNIAHSQFFHWCNYHIIWHLNLSVWLCFCHM